MDTAQVGRSISRCSTVHALHWAWALRLRRYSSCLPVAVSGILAVLILLGLPGRVQGQIPPLTLSIVSGNNQSGLLGVPLGAPFVVSVTSGGAVAGASITWTVTQGTGTLAPPSSTTGSNGLSQTTLNRDGREHRHGDGQGVYHGW